MMPWTAADAQRKTKKANTPELQRLWAEVANATLERTSGNDALAVREANGVVSRRSANDHHLGRAKRAAGGKPKD